MAILKKKKDTRADE